VPTPPGCTRPRTRSTQRESLQSRLLERITTKKQVPNEIYLQEEISSEEEDDDGETTNHQEEEQEDDDENRPT
jgi:hypothetical protein